MREEKHFIQRKDSDWLRLGDVSTVGLSLGLVSMGESHSQHTSEGIRSRECWKGEVPSTQIQIGTEASETPSVAQYFRILVNQQCTQLGSSPSLCSALCMSDAASVWRGHTACANPISSPQTAECHPLGDAFHPAFLRLFSFCVVFVQGWELNKHMPYIH